jgi:hypothetical protein
MSVVLNKAIEQVYKINVSDMPERGLKNKIKHYFRVSLQDIALE